MYKERMKNKKLANNMQKILDDSSINAVQGHARFIMWSALAIILVGITLKVIK